MNGMRFLHPPLIFKWEIANRHRRWQFNTCKSKVNYKLPYFKEPQTEGLNQQACNLFLRHLHHFNLFFKVMMYQNQGHREDGNRTLHLHMHTCTQNVLAHKKVYSVEMALLWIKVLYCPCIHGCQLMYTTREVSFSCYLSMTFLQA